MCLIRLVDLAEGSNCRYGIDFGRFSAVALVVPTILPVSLLRLVALASLALVVSCDLGESYVVALAPLALMVSCNLDRSYVVALALLALVVLCNLGESYVVALALLALVVSCDFGASIYMTK